MKVEVPVDTTIGRRDQKKHAVIARIKRAAAEAFAEHGFEGATMTDIADRADVAHRTLFNYITDKLDLLAFIMSDEFATVTGAMLPEAQWDSPLIDLVTTEFGRCMEVFLQQFPASLMILRETIWSDASGNMQGIAASRERILSWLQRLLEYKQSRGAITRNCKAGDIAWILFSVFITNTRRWLTTERPSLKSELRILRRQVSIVLNGLSPSSAESGD